MKVHGLGALPEDMQVVFGNVFGSNSHSYGDRTDVMSVTGLSRSERSFWLERRHPDLLEKDLRKSLASFVGSAVHKAVETKMKWGNPGYICEFAMSLETPLGTLFGTADLVDPKRRVLYDLKTVSPGKLGMIEKKIAAGDTASICNEYAAQVNVYRYMLRQTGIIVDKLQIIMLAQATMAYHKEPLYVFDIPVWTDDEVLAYIMSNWARIAGAKDIPEEALPSCVVTKDDAWKCDYCNCSGFCPLKK